ncbi:MULTISPECIES: hypothetical protein [Halomonadaceae]|uniref:Phage integrase SAM-like domain-containing protein n=1 Tax=Modicisalibacter ilicicola DSM 19980 TaxID=1121942 RepID=A0A1M5DH33_9GAMM|nr:MULTISPECIES: hypothetical protein [Halomonas]SHF66298.1 hypothetical protein SAMN02745148_03239 [Halomonas ilicicola DSM 19980]
MARLSREKLKVKKSADIIDVVPYVGWELEVEAGDPIDVSFLYNVAGGRLIQEQLSLQLRGQRKKRAVGNVILRFLRFMAKASGRVDANSLLEYKLYLDKDLYVSVHTKSQMYSAAAGFVKRLMAAEVIAHEAIPKNFDRVKKKTYPSIFELSAIEMERFAKEKELEIESLQKELGVGKKEAVIVKYGNEVLSAFHHGAIKKIKEWEEDCEKIDKAIRKYGSDDVVALGGVSDFREREGNWQSSIMPSRNFEGAIGVLYARFNRLLPASSEWPPGICDYLKSRGWPQSRVVAAFFNSTNNLKYFLVAALTHKDLLPNVDSVAFYSYLNSFEKGNEIGSINVFFGKKRGGPVNATLPVMDPLCEVFINFQERQKRLLSEVTGGANWLNKERCELFIIFSGKRGKDYRLKLVDPSSTVDMVRYAARDLSETYPVLRPLIGKITGKSFRPTIVAMDVAEGSSFSDVSKKLNHANFSTTAGYALRIETQSSLEMKLRNFQEYLLSCNRGEGERTGTGYFCGIKGEEGVTCKGVDMCFNCEAKRIILKDSRSLSEWLAWIIKIKKSMNRLKHNNPERWSGYWEVRLAEYESMVSLCTRSEVEKASLLAFEIEQHLPFLD